MKSLEEQIIAERNRMSNKVPFHQWLGFEIQEMHDGVAKVYAPFKSEFIGDYIRQRLHGGLQATMLDVVGAVAAASIAPTNPLGTVTMYIDYLRTGMPQDIFAEARVTHKSKSVIHVEAICYQNEEKDNPISRAQITFAIIKKNPTVQSTS